MTQIFDKKTVSSDGGTEQSGFVDVHCHCLPGLDDGPANMEEAVALCRALADDGIRTVVATAHQMGTFENRVTAEKIRKGVPVLQESLVRNGVPLEILPGSDCHIDERIMDMLAADLIVTVADRNRFLMLELPHNVFIDIEPLIRDLAYRNIGVIISHPERNRALCRQLDTVSNWLRYHVSLQLTAASLLGDFGSDVYSASWHFIEKGWASLVATDAHDLSSRPPRLRAAYEAIGRRCGRAAAYQLCIENPTRMIKSCDPLPVHAAKGRKVTEITR